MTLLDQILDKVEARRREVTIDTEGYTESQVKRILAAVEARGLHGAYDGRFVLVRDLRNIKEG